LSDEQLEVAERYLLLLLYAPGPRGIQAEPVRGDVWLQKELFLASRNVEPLLEEFEAYRLGPFSEAVEEYKSQLEISGYVESTASGITLTTKGKTIAEGIWKSADDDDRRLVQDAKFLLNDLSRDELLVLIYSSFKELTVNSDIRDEIARKKVEAALSLFRKRKVTLERAAKIADMSLPYFMRLLKTKGIRAVEITADELKEELSAASTPS
jgi:predicted HTH domain antitoxin